MQLHDFQDIHLYQQDIPLYSRCTAAEWKS